MASSTNTSNHPSISAMPSSVNPTNTHANDLPLPPLSALFLINFDSKKGYTITWSRTTPSVKLSDRVEYKSLPSGLHTVAHDLIYFVYDDPDTGRNTHAGLSAFVNTPTDDEATRNARMIAVGVLVPLSYGRLGRAWMHAPALKDLAAKLAEDREQTDSLEAYWEENKEVKRSDGQSSNVRASVDSPSVSLSELAPRHYERHGSRSDGAILASDKHELSPYHPAWSLISLLDKLGPLIFPVYRACLLRQRILISCHTPIHEICDFVYNLSILSNIPLSLSSILPDPVTPQSHRLRSLFAVGVHDIPYLTKDHEAAKRRQSSTYSDTQSESEHQDIDTEAGTGWVACTTDSILASKDTLWDILITMPPPSSSSSSSTEKAWPTVQGPKGVNIKATQRDLRRYHALRTGLSRPSRCAQQDNHDDNDDDSTDEAFDVVTEPLSWTALAYNGYMWWASAGEQLRSEEQDEATADAALLANLSLTPSPSSSPSRSPSSSHQTRSKSAKSELAIVAYFHRLTAQMLNILSDVVEAYPLQSLDDDNDDEDETLLAGQTPDYDIVSIDSETIEAMGLDVWSENDEYFVLELARVYFGREARIETKGVEVCGLRVC